MKKRTVIIVAVFILLAVLHQDEWNWDKSTLVFGFMPIGLAYHAAYSIVAALFWALVLKFGWPSHLERWAEGEDIRATEGDSGAS